MKTWVKVYTKALDSPDIGTLTWAHRGIFDALILLAGRLDYRDDEDQETGQLDTLERAAWRIRCDVGEFREAVSAFMAQGMVTENDGCLYLTNYYKHQRRAPSAQREAVKERVQRHRENKAENGNEDVTTLQEDVTLLDTEESRIDTDTDTEREGAANAASPPPETPPPKSKNSKRRQKKPVPHAITVFRENAHRFPAKSWYADVAQAVGDAETDLAFWGKVVKAYVGQGWNPTNVKNMLEFYGRREVPGDGASDGNATRSAYRTADEYPEGDEVLL